MGSQRFPILIDRQPSTFYFNEQGTNIWPQEVLEINMMIADMYFWQDFPTACGHKSSFCINFYILQ